MNTRKLTLFIDKPCNNDWDKMTVNEQGRHCSSCNKTVIDFSNYTDKQLVDFFKNMPEGICGHIPGYKLDTVLVSGDKSRSPFFKKLFWGTAIASWFGLVNKTDAKNPAAPKTVQTTNATLNRNTEMSDKDSLKKAISLSFYDETSKQAIPYVTVTLVVNGSAEQSYATSSNGVCEISLPGNMLGKKLTFECSATEYTEKQIELKVSSTPVNKKVYLKFEPRRIMVNGGLGMRPMDK